jgi:imidazolonepropionase-like amidohydrolase
MRTRPLVLLPLLATALLAREARAQGQLAARDFAIQAARIIPVDGAEIAPGMMLVRNGRIAAIGTQVKVPEGVPLLDRGKQVVMPGFVEAHSQRGLDRTYETAADASFLHVSDALNMLSIEIEDARRNGITTMLVAPDDRAFLAGRAAIIRPTGISIDAAVLKQDAALKISLLPSPGTSRMGHLAKLRKVLADARRDADQRAARPPDEKAEPDSARAAIAALLRDELPAIVYCATAEDVATAFDLAGENGFHLLPVVAPSAWRAIPLLQANHVTAIIGPDLESWEREPSGVLRHVELARLLSDAKVPFALTTDPYELGPQHPSYQAALAVRQGVPRATALEAITRVPARLLGYGGSKGVLKPGADADFVVLSDDPLSGDAFVDESYAKGARIYARSEDAKLRRLMSPGSAEPPLVAAEADHESDDEPPAQAPAGSPENEREQRWPAPPR